MSEGEEGAGSAGREVSSSVIQKAPWIGGWTRRTHPPTRSRQ